MLRITPMKNTAAAKKYLREGLSKSDYYSGGEQISGTWKGESAKLLGLSGQVVDPKVFDLLCDNLHPSQQTQLTSRNRDDRKPFYDFTFSAPKSVSILWATTSNPKLRMEIEKAMRAAVQQTMELGEKELTLARDQRGGQTIYNQTDNILFTEFLHDTTRPVGGQPDPHLHVHVAVFNLTFDQTVDSTDSVNTAKGAFRSLEFHDFAKFRNYLEAIHHSKLANLLQKDVGLNLYNTHKSFEIKNFSRDVIDNFSSRTLLVEQYAADNEIHSAKAKANIASITREHKGEGQTIEQLRSGWRNRFNQPTKQLIDGVFVSPFKASRGKGKLVIHENSTAALSSAIDHHFENSTVINQRDLISSALNSDLVGTSLEMVSKGLKGMKGLESLESLQQLNHNQNPVLSGTSQIPQSKLIATTRSNKGKQETVLTTLQIITEEQRLVELIKASKNNSVGLHTAYQLPTSMSPDQDKVLYQVLQSQDSINYIKGDAGAGKTYLLQNLKLALEGGESNLDGKSESKIRTIHAFAPTSIAGRKILREEVTQSADTVAKLLIDNSKGQNSIQNALDQSSIVFIDEAGMIGYQQMIQLLELQKQKGFHLILVGDTKQHPSMPRGDALRFLEQKTDLTPFTLTDNRRQKDNPLYKAAVDQLASRDVAGAFDTLDQMGAVKEIEQSTSRYNAIAKDYITLVKHSKNWSQARKEILIVTPTHEEASIITGKIRSELKKAGVIGEKDKATEKVTRDNDQSSNQISNQPKHELKPDIAYPALQDLKLTTAQKTLPTSYHKGQVLQFNQNVKGGYTIGSQWQVKLDKKSGQSVLTPLNPAKDVVNHKSQSMPIPYTDSKSFSVFEPRELKLTPGDLIKITTNSTNDQGKKLLNGSNYAIKSISTDLQTKHTQITLDNDWTLPKDFGHLSHGYTSTSYAAQGRTVKHLIISQSEVSLPGSSFQQGYVSASRGKESISWYTDDKAGLKKALGVMKQREFGVDVVGKVNVIPAAKVQASITKPTQTINPPAKIRVKELELGL